VSHAPVTIANAAGKEKAEESPVNLLPMVRPVSQSKLASHALATIANAVAVVRADVAVTLTPPSSAMKLLKPRFSDVTLVGKERAVESLVSPWLTVRPANQSQPVNHAPVTIANAAGKEKAVESLVSPWPMVRPANQSQLVSHAPVTIANAVAVVRDDVAVTRANVAMTKLRLLPRFSDVTLVGKEKAVESLVSLLPMVRLASQSQPVSHAPVTIANAAGKEKAEESPVNLLPMVRPANPGPPVNRALMTIVNAVAAVEKERAEDVDLVKERNNLAKMAKTADAAVTTTPSRLATKKLRLQPHSFDVLLSANEPVESPVSLLLMMRPVSLDKPVSQKTEGNNRVKVRTADAVAAVKPIQRTSRVKMLNNDYFVVVRETQSLMEQHGILAKLVNKVMIASKDVAGRQTILKNQPLNHFYADLSAVEVDEDAGVLRPQFPTDPLKLLALLVKSYLEKSTRT